MSDASPKDDTPGIGRAHAEAIYEAIEVLRTTRTGEALWEEDVRQFLRRLLSSEIDRISSSNLQRSAPCVGNGGLLFWEHSVLTNLDHELAHLIIGRDAWLKQYIDVALYKVAVVVRPRTEIDFAAEVARQRRRDERLRGSGAKAVWVRVAAWFSKAELWISFIGRMGTSELGDEDDVAVLCVA